MVIVGPSGSGKSTVLRCMNHLEVPTSGEVYIDGVHLEARTTDINRVRAEVGMVFQQFNLFPHLSVLDNITVAQRLVRKRHRARRRGTGQVSVGAGRNPGAGEKETGTALRRATAAGRHRQGLGDDPEGDVVR